MFVKNFPWSANEDSIAELFDGVQNVRLPTDRETGKMKGFGYVVFDSVASLDTAIAAGPYEMGGRSLHCDKAGNKPAGKTRLDYIIRYNRN